MPISYGFNALNTEPLQSSFNALANQGYRNQQLDLERQRQASDLQTQGLQRKQIQGAITKQHLDLMGGLAQDVAGEKDPAVRAQKWGKLASTFDAQDIAQMRELGIDPTDATNGPNQIVSLVRGYQDPLVRQKMMAEVKLAEAQANAANQKVNYPELIAKMFADPSLSGDNAQPGPSQPPEAQPSMQQGSYAPSGPQMNPSVNFANPGNASMGGPTGPGMPTPGGPTPAAGAVTPTIGANPYYMNRADKVIAMIAADPNAPRGLASDLNSLPGRKAQAAYLEANAKNQSALEERQRVGLTAIVPGIQRLRDAVNGASEEDWKGAMGPLNNDARQSPWSTPGVPFGLQAWNSPPMTPTEARAAFNPNATTNRQFDLQNGVKHLIGTLTAEYISNAGKLQITDAKMEEFRDLLDKASKATSRSEAVKILGTAEAMAKNVFGISGGLKGAEGRASTANTAAIEQGRDAIAKGADPNAVKQRLIEHGIDPSGL